MIDRAKLIIVLTLSIFVSTALATESECYTITGGGNGKPVRSYSSSNNTTTYTYTVQDNGGGARCGRIEALLIELIHCNGMPTIEVVDFSPDPKNGDMPPYHAENPGDFTVISDNIFGRNGLRWHGYAGPGTPNANQPEVLVGPNQSRVFSITVRGNNKPQTTAIPFTYLENGERVEPCGHLPGPSCEYMATPTPTPTPTPACPAYKLTRAVKGAIPGNIWSLSERETTLEEGRSLSCIQKLREYREHYCASNATVQKYNLYNKPLFAASQYNPAVKDRYDYVDRLTKAAGGQLCYAVSPLFTYLGNRACKTDSSSFLCEQYNAYQRVTLAASRRYHPRWQTVYFDKNCQPLLTPSAHQEAKACDASYVQTRFTGNCPISLLWDKDHDLERNASEASFPLELGAAASTRYEWKASAKAPLLVFDPERTGKITSATQLFGDWTFGGQKYASIDNGKTAVAWEHGYEPLATLDKNDDQVLSGEELNALSLWFDENQDGISQAGEVRPATDEGVTKIFFEKPNFDEDTHSHILLKGYERTIDGKTEILPSIDWTAEPLS